MLHPSIRQTLRSPGWKAPVNAGLRVRPQLSNGSRIRMVSGAVVDIVTAPRGKRPFRVVVDPTGDGADVTVAVMDRIKREMLHRTGLGEMIAPKAAS